MSSEYDRIVRDFEWRIPRYYNLGVALSDRPAANRQGTAIVTADGGLDSRSYSFAYISAYSNRLANLLAHDGWERGDRIAVLLPPSPAAAIAHVAIFKSGLICVPVITAQPLDSMIERFLAAGVGGIITSHEQAELHGEAWRALPGLQKVYVVTESADDLSCSFLENALEKARDTFTCVRTRADDPAILAFTSGTEGRPKGVLHAHRIVLGGLPAMHFSQMPRENDLVWSHFDWGWLGGLLVALVAWHCGSAILVHNQPVLNPGLTLDLLRKHDVTRISVAPTALKMLRQLGVAPNCDRLVSITAGGEKLDIETREWVREEFGVELCELYGLSECGAVLGSGCILPVRNGSIGKPAPGQTVNIVDRHGNVLGAGESGLIAVQAPHPQLFLGYWRDPKSTAEKFCGQHFITGDDGYRDGDGYYWYVARNDDLINVSGHRLGPAEVEDAFAYCEAVKACAAVGVPHSLSGERVVLWVELNDGWVPSRETEQLILAFGRARLAPYQLPGCIRFVDNIPRTATGKVNRRLMRKSESRERGG